ncbi:MAG TPA: ABC transporter ATP-binding protein [Candidatus Polarisedimenticolia bacterium]|jgi:ABC-type multidrug transport system ATPase subunit|nr:ABC transporter ATP-binding protein [Candidatus Polarisedimenticolia bacterium]
MTPELVVDNISKTYSNGVQALKGVSLRIPAGMFGLLGPNGAGKSTLMRTIATLQEPDTGSITFGEIDVLRQKDAVRRTLGYLPQEFGLYPKVSALEMLEHFAVLKGIVDGRKRAEIVEAVMHRTNLWDVRKRKLGTFSGGMKQRFGIAQALLGNPRLMIVDEPTAGLDPAERLRFHNMLSEIGENVVVILSTHIVEDVSDLCSRMAIIAAGRVLVSGEPQSAIESLRGRVWKKIVPRDQIAAYEREMSVISTHLVAGRTALHVLSPARPNPTFEEVSADLEDVYFSTLRDANQKAA